MRMIGAGVVGAVVAAVLAASGAGSPSGVPLPPRLGTMSAEVRDMQPVAGTHGAGRFSSTYDPATRTLTWRLDYKLTTGPVTAVRVRARVGGAVVARTLCDRCASTARTGEHGRYFSVSGKIRSPSRDVVLLAVPALLETQSQVVAATHDHPRGELYGDLPQPPGSGAGGGRCC